MLASSGWSILGGEREEARQDICARLFFTGCLSPAIELVNKAKLREDLALPILVK